MTDASSTAGIGGAVRNAALIVGFRRRRFLGVLTLILLAGLTEGLGLFLLIPLLALVGVDVGAAGVPSGWIDRLGARLGPADLDLGLGAVLSVYALIVGLRALLDRHVRLRSFELQQAFTDQLREDLYRAVIRARWLVFLERQGTDFSHTLIGETDRAGDLMRILLSFFSSAVIAATYFVFALFLSPVATLSVTLLGALLLLALHGKAAAAEEKGRAVSSAYRELYAIIGEHIAGMKLIKSHGVEERPTAAFLGTSKRVKEAHLDVQRNHVDVGLLSNLGSVVVLCSLLYASVRLFALPSGSILLIVLMFARLVPMYSGLQTTYQDFMDTLPALTEVRSLQAEAERRTEAPPAHDPGPTLDSRLEFRGVSFRYAPDSPPALDHVDLSLEAGKVTAIVGLSGAGKSTLVDLVTGLIAPTSGEIRVDGRPLSDDRLRGWRSRISYVPQDTYLFNDSVRANLRFLTPTATEEEMTRALRSVAAEFVFELPSGLDTVLGDRGVRLSGGERQRIVLARALLRSPSLLVLDEATSALDLDNEERVQATMRGLAGRVTVLIVAHRLSTIRQADTIYVLEDGRTVQTGSWESLVSQEGGRFRALLGVQMPT